MLYALWALWNLVPSDIFFIAGVIRHYKEDDALKFCEKKIIDTKAEVRRKRNVPENNWILLSISSKRSKYVRWKTCLSPENIRLMVTQQTQAPPLLAACQLKQLHCTRGTFKPTIISVWHLRDTVYHYRLTVTQRTRARSRCAAAIAPPCSSARRGSWWRTAPCVPLASTSAGTAALSSGEPSRPPSAPSVILSVGYKTHWYYVFIPIL